MAGTSAMLDFSGDDFIRREHAFLDELVRNVVLDFFQPRRPALIIEPDFHLGEIEIERTGGETILAQQRGQLPSELDAFARSGVTSSGTGLAIEMHLAAALVVRRRRTGLFENRKRLPIGQPRGAVDHRLGEARRLILPLGSKSNERRMVSRSTRGLRLQTPLLSRSGSIGMTRSAR